MKKLVISESELTKLIQKAVGKKLDEQISSEFSVEPEVGKTKRETELEDVFGKYSGEVPADVIRYMRKNPKLIISRMLDIYGAKMVDYMIDSAKSNVEPEGEDLMEGSADENGDGVISKEELYNHFDLDGDGVVTMDDYAVHVDYHCENPELLDSYRDSDSYREKMDLPRGEFDSFFETSKAMNEQIEDEERMEKYPVDDFDFELDKSDIMDIYSFKGPVRRFRGSIYVDGIVPQTDDTEYDRELAKKIMEFYRREMSNQESYVGGVGFKQRSLLDPYDNMDF